MEGSGYRVSTQNPFSRFCLCSIPWPHSLLFPHAARRLREPGRTLANTIFLQTRCHRPWSGKTYLLAPPRGNANPQRNVGRGVGSATPLPRRRPPWASPPDRSSFPSPLLLAPAVVSPPARLARRGWDLTGSSPRWCLRRGACTCTPVPGSTRTRIPSSQASSVLWRRWAGRELAWGGPSAGSRQYL